MTELRNLKDFLYVNDFAETGNRKIRVRRAEQMHCINVEGNWQKDGTFAWMWKAKVF